MPAIKLIVGLGNPGSQYENTRHNVGAWFVEQLSKQYSSPLKLETKFSGCASKAAIDHHMCWLLIPTTYMNESGRSVAAIARFYKIQPEEILVAHDELDFEAGIIRVKENGGHGGHNGLRDIINHLHTKDFPRMRIGIGHPGHKDKVSPYVLSAPSRSDKQKIDTAIDDGCSVIPELLAGDVQKAFRYLHND